MKSRVVVLAAWLLFVSASPAFAYVDPGSGAMLTQLLLGGAAGLIVLLRLYWNRLLGLFGLKNQNRPTDGKA